MTQAHITTPLDRSEKSGSIGLVLVVAGLLVGVAVALAFVANDVQRYLIVVLLALLSAIGTAALFAIAVGLLRFAGRGPRNDLTKAVVDSSAEAVLVVEPDGKIAYANPAYFRLTGAQTPETLKTVERFFAGPAEMSETIYRLAKAAREGKIMAEDIRLASARGEHGAWYRVKVAPVPRPGGRIAAAWTVADVSRERERQENVFQELQFAIDFLDHAPAGFLSIEPDGDVTHINATLAGWLDRDLAAFSPGALKLRDIMAGDGAALIAAIAGAPGEVKTEILDLDMRHRSGRFLPVRLLHRLAFGHDGRPGPSRTLVLNRAPGEDLSEGLRAAEVRFARFFNNTPMAIATVGRSGAIVRSNASFVKLFARAWQAGEVEDSRSILATVTERDRDALKQAIDAAAAGKGDIPALDVTLAGEGLRTARFFVSGVEPGEGEGENAIVYALETTEQRALEAQFAQAQKMNAVGQLAGGIAHDFNNVLQAIIGYSDLLLASHKPTDQHFPDIMQIKQNANRAAGLVRQLLAFSRRQTLRPQTIALGDVISDLSMLLKRLTGETIDLDIRHGRDLWFVKADVNQFEQVAVNLAVNARDAMPKGGKLTIRTANVPAAEAARLDLAGLPVADYVLFEVSDTGVGIPPDIIDKIFEPFFSTKDVGKGTGLGLSTVYGIVKQTGGFIYCDSETGKGTTFRIFLPRTVEEERRPDPAAASRPPPAADLTGSGTVLLVEDEEAVRQFAARALTSRGYRVLMAGSGAEALEVEKVHEGPIDLVLSDVVMPELDGPSMLKELRKRRRDFKVIFMSGHAEDAFEKSLDRDEDFSFIAKPFSLKDLVEAVKKALAG